MIFSPALITIDSNRRFGKPCVRNTSITVGDVLGWLAAGMDIPQILGDYPSLTRDDILACLAYAAEREQHSLRLLAVAA